MNPRGVRSGHSAGCGSLFTDFVQSGCLFKKTSRHAFTDARLLGLLVVQLKTPTRHAILSLVICRTGSGCNSKDKDVVSKFSARGARWPTQHLRSRCFRTKLSNRSLYRLQRATHSSVWGGEQRGAGPYDAIFLSCAGQDTEDNWWWSRLANIDRQQLRSYLTARIWPDNGRGRVNGRDHAPTRHHATWVGQSVGTLRVIISSRYKTSCLITELV